MAATAGGCNAIWGIDTPIVESEQAGDAGTDGAAGGGAGEDAASGGSDTDANASASADAGAADCGGASPDDTTGIFVEPDGADTASCGSRADACRTIQAGLDRAHAVTGKTRVFVARGTYAESLHLYAGVALVGGWDVIRGAGGDATWIPACRGAPSEAVVVSSDGTSNVTASADDLGGAASVATLTIASKPHAGPGESIYGLFARGATTELALDDVVVNVASGGDGAAGVPGDGGAPGAGDCPQGTGANGLPDGARGPNADAGAFTTTGFVAASGAQGSRGTAGANGAAGAGGSCVTCVACGGGLVSCSQSTTGQSCGAAGGAGCGGGAGEGGGGGGGGGSSVALFAWDARVIANGGSMRSGNGGAGGAGAAGGQGGHGATGSSGKSGATCTTACGGILPCGPTDAGAGGPGTSSQGGTGSAGGAGGGGAGGWSFAVVTGGAATVTLGADVQLDHGNYGAGAGGAADGRSGDRYP